MTWGCFGTPSWFHTGQPTDLRPCHHRFLCLNPPRLTLNSRRDSFSTWSLNDLSCEFWSLFSTVLSSFHPTSLFRRLPFQYLQNGLASLSSLSNICRPRPCPWSPSDPAWFPPAPAPALLYVYAAETRSHKTKGATLTPTWSGKCGLQSFCSWQWRSWILDDQELSLDTERTLPAALASDNTWPCCEKAKVLWTGLSDKLEDQRHQELHAPFEEVEEHCQTDPDSNMPVHFHLAHTEPLVFHLQNIRIRISLLTFTQLELLVEMFVEEVVFRIGVATIRPWPICVLKSDISSYFLSTRCSLNCYSINFLLCSRSTFDDLTSLVVPSPIRAAWSFHSYNI